jgi:aspartyl-tRNA synthetase
MRLFFQHRRLLSVPRISLSQQLKFTQLRHPLLITRKMSGEAPSSSNPSAAAQHKHNAGPTIEDLAKQLDASQLVDAEGNPLSKNALKKLIKDQEKAKKAAQKEQQKAAQQQQEEEDYAADKYGRLPLNQSQSKAGYKWAKISELSKHIDEVVTLRARVHNTRAKGKQAFLELREQSSTVQGLLMVDKEGKFVSKQMVKFAGSIKLESIVLVEAKVVKAAMEVKGCTEKEVELQIQKIFIESEVKVEKLPFTLADASRTEEEVEKAKAEGVSLNEFKFLSLGNRCYCAFRYSS